MFLNEGLITVGYRTKISAIEAFTWIDDNLPEKPSASTVSSYVSYCVSGFGDGCGLGAKNSWTGSG